MDVGLEKQQAEVAAEETALLTLVRPVLLGVMSTVKQDKLAEVGGWQGVKLKMLPSVHRQGDGDYGICFEYAVHDALLRQTPAVCERIADALRMCRLDAQRVDSILFSVEKNRRQSLIDTGHGLLTDDSVLLPARRARPIRLREHLDSIARAFSQEKVRQELPSSIRGVWKADLFLGGDDRWVGTTVKVVSHRLEAAPGLRVGVVPARSGRDDRVELDEQRNLVICPLPYDGAFVEMFFHAWKIVEQLIASDLRLPREVHLPKPSHRRVAGELVERREFPVVEVLDALLPMTQPHLMVAQTRAASLYVVDANGAASTERILVPSPLGLTDPA